MRTITFSSLLLSALVAALACPPAAAVELDIETFCTVGRHCRVKVTSGNAADGEAVVTSFHANRVGPDMRYLPAEHYGANDIDDGGLFHLDRRVVLDEAGAFVAPQPGDAPGDVLRWTMTVALDPQGRATFFSGVLHAPGSAVARRAYVWGYPPTTVKNIGSIGGPRSPVAPRKPPSLQRQEQDTALQFGLGCDPENRCRVQVLLGTGREIAQATTDFRANTLGEDMRYYPSETAGGADLLAGDRVYQAELDVVTGPRGGLRSARSDDPPQRVETMTTAIALSSTGHVTFFYGFLRDPGSNHVRRFLIWGYPPGTLMVDDPDDAEDSGGGPQVDAGDPRRT